jgi:hypothetical protein
MDMTLNREKLAELTSASALSYSAPASACTLRPR